MINIIRLLSAFFVIILLTPQTVKDNFVLKMLHSKRLLANYGEEKRFLNTLSWLSIFFFLSFVFFSLKR